MESLAEILPKAIRRGQIGRKIREQEELTAFEFALTKILPGDLRSYVRGLYVQGSILTCASLSISATMILKQKQFEVLREMKHNEPGSKVLKLRILA